MVFFFPLLVEVVELVSNVHVKFLKVEEKFFLQKSLILQEKKFLKGGDWVVKLKLNKT